MKCAICNGVLAIVTDKLPLTIEGQDILITNVEMVQCRKSGEKYLTAEMDQKVEGIVERYKQGETTAIRREIVELTV